MKPTLRTAAIALAATVSGGILVAPVQAYPVDCAILLCLAGGWPASVPCAHARIEFICRITPFPIEPPLQIWRCPLGAVHPHPMSPAARLVDATYPGDEMRWSPAPPRPNVVLPAQGSSGTDLGDPAFAFIRSIRVFHIQYGQYENRDDRCRQYDLTEVGTYDLLGAFTWSEASIRDLPPAVDLALPDHCDDHRYRSVFVDWTDHSGSYGFEEVRY